MANKMPWIAGIAVVFACVQGCGPSANEPADAPVTPADPAPPSQRDFERIRLSLQRQDQRADASSDESLKSHSREVIESFLKNTRRTADRWVATVENASPKLIEAKRGPTTFHMMVLPSVDRSIYRDVAKGDLIYFSGELGPEKSVTLSGGLSEPEFRFYPYRIDTEGLLVVAQSPEAINEEIAKLEQQARDEEVAASAMQYCERRVLERLKSPKTADFPLLGGSVQSDGKGVFAAASHVDSKNGFGAIVRSNFTCVMKYNAELGPSSKDAWTLVALSLK